MGLLSLPQAADGETAEASDINDPVNQIANEFNGNIENVNIKAGAAIATSKLATDAGISTGMIANSAVDSTKVAAGAVVQVVNTTSSAVATGNTDMANDDTIPQNTEGDEYMTLAITPKSATNILVIEVRAFLAVTGAAADVIGAIFQDTTANALAAGTIRSATADTQNILFLRHVMTAGTTSSTTFKFRAGPQAGGSTMTFNGAAGSRKFGAIPKSDIVIWEYKA